MCVITNIPNFLFLVYFSPIVTLFYSIKLPFLLFLSEVLLLLYSIDTFGILSCTWCYHLLFFSFSLVFFKFYVYSFYKYIFCPHPLLLYHINTRTFSLCMKIRMSNFLFLVSFSPIIALFLFWCRWGQGHIYRMIKPKKKKRKGGGSVMYIKRTPLGSDEVQ